MESPYRNYVAIIEQNKRGQYFGHFPDLPGVTASARTIGELGPLLAELADDYVTDLVKDGHAVPDDTAWKDVKAEDDVNEVFRVGINVRIPPGVPRVKKISISVAEEALDRIDHASVLTGETRSGFLVAAALERAQSLLSTRNQELIARAIESGSLKLSEIVGEAMRGNRARDNNGKIRRRTNRETAQVSKSHPKYGRARGG